MLRFIRQNQNHEKAIRQNPERIYWYNCLKTCLKSVLQVQVIKN